MSIRLKIILAFLTMAAMMVAQAVISIQAHDGMKDLVDAAVNKTHRAVEDLGRFGNELQKLRRYEKEYFIYVDDSTNRNKYAGEWKDSYEQAESILESMARNEHGAFTPREAARFEDWREAIDFYGSEFSGIVKRYGGATADGSAASPAQANAMIHDGKTRLAGAMDEANAMGGTKMRDAARMMSEVDARTRDLQTLYVFLTGSAILVAAILVFMVPGAINQTLGRLLRDAERISRDDLSTPVERSPVPEFDVLAKALETIRVAKLAASQKSGAAARR